LGQKTFFEGNGSYILVETPVIEEDVMILMVIIQDILKSFGVLWVCTR